MAERKYQAKLIKKLERMFPGCMILKNDANYLQGVPDLLILYYGIWAALEVKDAADAQTQPNQEYYVNKMADMAFAAFICPETERDVLNALQQTFETRGSARIP